MSHLSKLIYKISRSGIGGFSSGCGEKRGRVLWLPPGQHEFIRKYQIIIKAQIQSNFLKLLQNLTNSILTAKHFFQFLQIFRFIFQYLRPEHECSIKFASSTNIKTRRKTSFKTKKPQVPSSAIFNSELRIIILTIFRLY